MLFESKSIAMDYYDQLDAYDAEQEEEERQERQELEDLWAAGDIEGGNEGDGGRVRNVVDLFAIPDREFKIRYRFAKV